MAYWVAVNIVVAIWQPKPEFVQKQQFWDPCCYSPPKVDRIEHGVYGGSYYNTPKAIFYLLKRDYRTCASYRLHEQEAELSCLRAKLGLGLRVFNAAYRHCDYHFCSCGLLYLGSPVNP